VSNWPDKAAGAWIVPTVLCSKHEAALREKFESPDNELLGQSPLTVCEIPGCDGARRGVFWLYWRNYVDFVKRGMEAES
jgi:hypothetical protein